MFFALAILAVAAVGILGAIAETVAPKYETPTVTDYGAESPRDLRVVDACGSGAPGTGADRKIVENSMNHTDREVKQAEERISRSSGAHRQAIADARFDMATGEGRR